MNHVPEKSLAVRVLEGDVRGASRLMRLIDDGDPAATQELQTIFKHTGKTYVVGITGPPGAGKSTLTECLIAHYRKQNYSVGVIAVDPTSPFTGGAILGDRIRMQNHATDAGVFIRSFATRGNLGGLSRATGDCLKVMEAMGRDVVLIETVGVGQDEIDIAHLAHTTIVVLVPGMGDDIQAIKAGILEVADIFCINKADHDGADRVVRELRTMLELRHAVRTPPMEHDTHHRMVTLRAENDSVQGHHEEWEIPIQKVIAIKAQGIDALGSQIKQHREYLESTGDMTKKNRARALTHFIVLLRDRLLKAGLERLEQESGNLSELASRIAKREADPYALVEELTANAQ